MMAQDSGNGYRVDLPDIEATALDLSEISDAALRAELERREERIYSFGDDIVDGWLGMAPEFYAAHEKLARNRTGYWQRWVARFQGFISRSTADKLVEIGKMERSELEALRSQYFQRGTGIAAIAAYLAAPSPVQELVRSGTIEPTGSAIERASSDPASDEFRKLTAELGKANAAAEAARTAEQKANAAVANVEERIEEIRKQFEFQADLRVQDVTARLQREVDEARHQADMRQKDIEQTNREIQRAQSEWQQQQAAFQAQLTEATTKATQTERERAERTYTDQMTTLQRKLEAKTREAQDSNHKLKTISDQLNDARNAVGVRARWDILAADLVARLDDAIGRLPSAVEAEYFERNEYILADAVRKRAEQLAERMRELASAGINTVEAGQ